MDINWFGSIGSAINELKEIDFEWKNDLFEHEIEITIDYLIINLILRGL